MYSARRLRKRLSPIVLIFLSTFGLAFCFLSFTIPVAPFGEDRFFESVRGISNLEQLHTAAAIVRAGEFANLELERYPMRIVAETWWLLPLQGSLLRLIQLGILSVVLTLLAVMIKEITEDRVSAVSGVALSLALLQLRGTDNTLLTPLLLAPLAGSILFYGFIMMIRWERDTSWQNAITAVGVCAIGFLTDPAALALVIFWGMRLISAPKGWRGAGLFATLAAVTGVVVSWQHGCSGWLASPGNYLSNLEVAIPGLYRATHALVYTGTPEFNLDNRFIDFPTLGVLGWLGSASVAAVITIALANRASKIGEKREILSRWHLVVQVGAACLFVEVFTRTITTELIGAIGAALLTLFLLKTCRDRLPAKYDGLFLSGVLLGAFFMAQGGVRANEQVVNKAAHRAATWSNLTEATDAGLLHELGPHSVVVALPSGTLNDDDIAALRFYAAGTGARPFTTSLGASILPQAGSFCGMASKVSVCEGGLKPVWVVDVRSDRSKSSSVRLARWVRTDGKQVLSNYGITYTRYATAEQRQIALTHLTAQRRGVRNLHASGGNHSLIVHSLRLCGPVNFTELTSSSQPKLSWESGITPLLSYAPIMLVVTNNLPIVPGHGQAWRYGGESVTFRIYRDYCTQLPFRVSFTVYTEDPGFVYARVGHQVSVTATSQLGGTLSFVVPVRETSDRMQVFTTVGPSAPSYVEPRYQFGAVQDLRMLLTQPYARYMRWSF